MGLLTNGRWPALLPLVAASLIGRASAESVCVTTGALVERSVWNSGMSADLKLQFPSAVSSWSAEVTFDHALTSLVTWAADATTTDNTVYTFTNKNYNGVQSADNELTIAFNTYFSSKADVISIKLNGVELCSGTTTAATTTTTTAATTTTTAATTTTATTTTTTAATTTTATTTTTTAATTTAGPGAGEDCLSSDVIRENNVWNTGMSADLVLRFPSAVSSWSVQLTFDRPLERLDLWDADAVTSDNTAFTLTNKYYNGNQAAGSDLVVSFNAYFASKPTVTSVVLNGVELCTGTGGTTATTSSTAGTTASTTVGTTASTTTSTTASTTAGTTASTTAATTSAPPTEGSTVPPTDLLYDYNEVVKKSLLFYEAQRSGPLPADNRISWRGDSALDDGSDVGLDLTGGYYDAGDHVKFGFPMAGMTTVLAWGALSFADGYEAAGQTDYMLAAIRWATDYFVKCHVAPTVFYGQVGDGNIDHDWWGRPEDMTMSRPSYNITASAPGSDLAGETAAALAAASLVFRASDPTYADLLLGHARELYDFADQYRGMYHNSITDAAQFYKSWSGYGDELTWAAAWLHRATGESSYLSAAELHFQQFSDMQQQASEFSWDGKHVGAQLLLYEATSGAQYGQLVSQFCDWLVSGAPRTPQGLLFLQPWGSLRHAANAALVCLQAAEAGLSPVSYRALAKQQINLMLGDAGRSFVVGFGENPPQRPHHKAASCPDAPDACGWDQLSTSDPNPQVLNGALVGGPDANGNYQDVRTDYVKNEVTTDYNAGFQGAVAGLLSLHVRGLFPA